MENKRRGMVVLTLVGALVHVFLYGKLSQIAAMLPWNIGNIVLSVLLLGLGAVGFAMSTKGDWHKLGNASGELVGLGFAFQGLLGLTSLLNAMWKGLPTFEVGAWPVTLAFVGGILAFISLVFGTGLLGKKFDSIA